jgi:hypothetical protein
MNIKSVFLQFFSKCFGDSKILLLFLILVEISFILLSNTISFETSDERTMNLIASGGYTGEPSERLIYIHIFIGYFLKFLYSYLPFLNWYTWFLIITLTISFISFQFVVNTCFKSLKIKFLAHIILLCVVFPLFVNICFTKIAAFTFISGLVLIVFNDTSRLSLIFGYFLVLLGVAIRSEVFFLLLLFIFPVYISALFQKKIKRLIHPSIVFILGIALSAFHYFQYRNSNEWKFHSDINYLRSRITTYDNPNFQYDQVKKALIKANWTKTDYDFVSKFYFDLGIKKFSPETLKGLVDPPKGSKYNFELKQVTKLLFKNFKKFTGFITHNIISIIVLFGIILLFIKRKWNVLIQIALLTIYCFLLINAFEIFFNGNYTKQRLLWVVVYSIYGVILFQSFNVLSNKSIKYTFIGVASFSLIFLFSQRITNYSKSSTNGYELQKYIEKKSDRLYVSWPSLEQLDVFEIPIHYKNAYFLGWLQGSPHNLEKLKSNFINNPHGIYEVTQPYDWYFIKVQNDIMTADNLELVKRFYSENYRNIGFKTFNHSIKGIGSYTQLKIFFLTHQKHEFKRI